MNETNYNILKSMNKTEYVTFLKEALGFYHFLDNKGMQLQGSKNKSNKSHTAQEFATLLDLQGKIVNTYFLHVDSNKSLAFFDARGEEYNVATFFDEKFDDSIMFCLLIASKKQKTPFVYDEIIKITPAIDETSIREMLDKEVETSAFFLKKELKRYSFILGAGINKGLGPKNWDDLIKDMRQSVKSLTTLSDKDLDDFKDKICNTTYVIPQILKDLNENEYFKILDQSIYSSFKPYDVMVKRTQVFENTTIYQIARILASNIKDNKALTFNYDEILELVLNLNFGVNASSIFKGRSKVTSLPIIYHTHGFWPYSETKTKTHKKSIVLSSIEYMESYQSLQDYSAQKLNSFIDDTCILVGNSLSDYEEQKIFKGHHKKNMAQFSFLFLCEKDVWRRKYYLIYFLQIGVIPIFFKTFDEMVDFLKTL